MSTHTASIDCSRCHVRTPQRSVPNVQRNSQLFQQSGNNDDLHRDEGARFLRRCGPTYDIVHCDVAWSRHPPRQCWQTHQDSSRHRTSVCVERQGLCVQATSRSARSHKIPSYASTDLAWCARAHFPRSKPQLDPGCTTISRQSRTSHSSGVGRYEGVPGTSSQTILSPWDTHTRLQCVSSQTAGRCGASMCSSDMVTHTTGCCQTQTKVTGRACAGIAAPS